MKTLASIAIAAFSLLFMAGTALADHSIFHQSNKLFSDPSSAGRADHSLSNPYDKPFQRRRVYRPSDTGRTGRGLRGLSDEMFDHRRGPPDGSLHDQADKLFGH